MKWGIRRYQNEDGTLTEEGKHRYGKKYHSDYIRAHYPKKVRKMSNSELQAVNSRLQLERQYDDLVFNSKDIVRGAKYLSAALATYATVSRLNNDVLNLGKKFVSSVGHLILRAGEAADVMADLRDIV